MPKGRMLGVIVVALLSIMGLGGVAIATTRQTSTYAATFSGGEEVPPNDSPATGQATFAVSADGTALHYTVIVDNITNLTTGHIHLGMPGENGPVVLPLFPNRPPGGGRTDGTVGEGTATAAQLVGPLQGRPLSELVAAMQAGNTYVNLHTNSGAAGAAPGVGNLPVGEIRGQIVAASGGGAPGAVASPTVVPAMTPPPAPVPSPTVVPAARPTPVPELMMPTAPPSSGAGFLARSTVPISGLGAAVGLGLLLTLGLGLGRHTRRAQRP